MKPLFLICLLLHSVVAFSQKKTVTAVYSVIGIEDPNRALVDDMVLKKNSFFLNEMSKQTFTLVADSRLSFFKMDSRPSKEIEQGIKMWIGTGIEGMWQDSRASYIIFLKNPAIESDFIMEVPTVKDWTITNESKLIEGYVCYKAVSSTKTVTPQDKEFVKTAIAWFCPEIPFSFGPMKYGGLPGLIMELQTDSYHFGLKKLSLNSVNEVKPMPDLKIMTSSEHQKQFLERARKKRK